MFINYSLYKLENSFFYFPSLLFITLKLLLEFKIQNIRTKMIKPSPIKVACKDCGFKKLFAPKSDALIKGHYNREFCTQCKSKNIMVISELSIIDRLLSSILK